MTPKLFQIVVACSCLVTCAKPSLPPLMHDADGSRLPGKFIWADLFTSEFDAAREFYAQTFGWEWRWMIQDPPLLYGMFYNDGLAVAGVAYRADAETGRSYGRWIHYLSVADAKSASDGTVARGGRVLLEQRSYPDRGDFAVVADAEGAPFGVLHSTAGDPPDFEAALGEWLWFGLFSRDAKTASKFYATLFGYEVYDSDDGSDVLEYILAAGGHSRAGIAQLSAGSEEKPTWLGFVRVDDVGATLERARSAGAEVLFEPKHENLAGQLAIFADPYGAVVGVMTWDFEAADAEGEGASR